MAFAKQGASPGFDFHAHGICFMSRQSTAIRKGIEHDFVLAQHLQSFSVAVGCDKFHIVFGQELQHLRPGRREFELFVQ